MGVAATFAILAALFFWFPKMFGRRLNELGKLTSGSPLQEFIASSCPCTARPGVPFAPSSGPTAIDTLGASLPSTVGQSFGGSLRTFVTVATILTVAAQVLFLSNFLWSLWRGEKTNERNPWRATTLEWTVLSPAPIGNFGASEPMVYRGAYEFGAQGVPEDFAAQNVAPAPSEPPLRTKQQLSAGAKGELEYHASTTHRHCDIEPSSKTSVAEEESFRPQAEMTTATAASAVGLNSRLRGAMPRRS